MTGVQDNKPQYKLSTVYLSVLDNLSYFLRGIFKDADKLLNSDKVTKNI